MRIAALLSVVLVGCAPDLVVQGRPVGLQIPSDASGPLPLVILAHGYAANGALQDSIFPFSKQVEEKRFLYALPNGVQDKTGKRFWNATDACCDFGDVPVDDVGFFRAIIDEVKSRYDVSHVFVVGHSNGAFMTLRLACEASDVIDGVVAVSGSTWNQVGRCRPGRAIPTLLVHGTADTVIPYEGREGLYPGAVETGRRFAARNGCSGTWEELERADFVEDSATETKRQRQACPAGAAVELWSLEDIGHVPTFDARWTQATLGWLKEHLR